MRLHSAWRSGLVAATAAAVTLGIAAPAAAHWAKPAPVAAYRAQPAPGWGVFRQCPVTGTLAPAGSGKVMVCLHGVATVGTINIGGLDTTFRGPGLVQGGTGTLGSPPS